MENSDKQERKSLWQRFKYYIWWFHLQYLLTTGLYMLETWERVIFNIILLGFLAMSAYSTYVYLPGHIASLLQLIGLMDADTSNSSSSLPHSSTFGGNEL